MLKYHERTHKDGEGWVLQSVMKKIIDQDKNK